jgi:ferredoxin/flavodoxin---NADP+ reductase
VDVDIFDALPVPCGLVRYGVAPDHFSIRSVRDKLVETLDNPRVRFFGNVTVGSDVSTIELSNIYDAVVYTYGASEDRKLGIPGEESATSIPATEFVKWYTGHPDSKDFTEVLKKARNVVVIGLGNVAVDVTRVLVKSDAEMSRTDMPDSVLEALRNSSVERVQVVGRRGPQHATFTTKELKELGELEGVAVRIHPEDLPSNDIEACEGNRIAERNLKVMRDWVVRTDADSPKTIDFRFFSTPRSYSESSGEFEVERMSMSTSGEIAPTGIYENLKADLVIRSVGYKGAQLDGLPFDSSRNVIPSDNGKIIGADRSYVAGWIKRGPTGIIGTNKKDAVSTIAALMSEFSPQQSQAQPREFIVSLLNERGIDFVDAQGWKRIDAAERGLGEKSGKERITIRSRAELLQRAKGL